MELETTYTLYDIIYWLTNYVCFKIQPQLTYLGLKVDNRLALVRP